MHNHGPRVGTAQVLFLFCIRFLFRVFCLVLLPWLVSLNPSFFQSHLDAIFSFSRGLLGAEEHLVDRVVFNGGADLMESIEHHPGDDLVPAEVPLDVDAFGAALHGFPDRRAGGHAAPLHLVGLGDHTGALVAEDADRLAAERRGTDPLAGYQQFPT